MIVIEKGIPPAYRGDKKREKTVDSIPWANMEVGDSFIIRLTSSGGLRRRARVHGYEILIRAIEFHEDCHYKPSAFRVWRIS